jgi:hypothetical protein
LAAVLEVQGQQISITAVQVDQAVAERPKVVFMVLEEVLSNRDHHRAVMVTTVVMVITSQEVAEVEQAVLDRQVMFVVHNLAATVAMD